MASLSDALRRAGQRARGRRVKQEQVLVQLERQWTGKQKVRKHR